MLLTGKPIQKKAMKERINKELNLNLPEHTYNKIIKELPIVQTGNSWIFKSYL